MWQAAINVKQEESPERASLNGWTWPIRPGAELSGRCRVSCRVAILAHLNWRRKENEELLKPESQPQDRQTAHPFCQPEKGLKFGNFLSELLGLSFVSIVYHGDIWLEGLAESSSHPWNE